MWCLRRDTLDTAELWRGAAGLRACVRVRACAGATESIQTYTRQSHFTHRHTTVCRLLTCTGYRLPVIYTTHHDTVMDTHEQYTND